MRNKFFKLLLFCSFAAVFFIAGREISSTVSASHDGPSVSPTLPSPEEFTVVRAYFDDPQMVRDLARWLEPWEVHYDLGYLVVGVTPVEANLLRLAGFRLEIDPILTEKAIRPLTPLPGQVSGIPGYPCYRTVEETFASAQNLAANYPAFASWIDIGNSWDKQQPGGSAGYDLMVLKLTNSAIPGLKPKLFVMSAIHAREYTTAELVTRFGEYLLAQYGSNPDVTWLLDYQEIHLLLQSNPDGRKLAETGLLWRKNTNTDYCSNLSKRGADLNRNFSFLWNCCGGSSNDPCNEIFHGISAASEPETQAVQDYVRSIFPDQRGDDLNSPAPVESTGVFLDIHSYSQLVLWPWGFTSNLPPNNNGLKTLGRKFAYFNGYSPSQAIELYPTDGTTDDFAYGELGLASFTFELGNTFFESCSSFESTIFPTNLQALVYAAKVTLTPYLTPAGPEALNVTSNPALVPLGTPLVISANINDTRFNNSNGTEPTQNIAGAEYSIDTPPWVPGVITYPMNPTDGSFNQKVESINAALDTSGLSPGRHTAFLRGQDAAGNWGPISATFFEVQLFQFTFVPPDSSGFGAPGFQVLYLFDLTNTGSTSDTFTVTANGFWPVSMSTPNGPLLSGNGIELDSGESIQLSVIVSIPPGSPYGLSDQTQLTIASQGDPTKSAQANLTTTSRKLMYFPLLQNRE